jgi:hypothetical protein
MLSCTLGRETDQDRCPDRALVLALRTGPVQADIDMAYSRMSGCPTKAPTREISGEEAQMSNGPIFGVFDSSQLREVSSTLLPIFREDVDSFIGACGRLPVVVYSPHPPRLLPLQGAP